MHILFCDSSIVLMSVLQTEIKGLLFEVHLSTGGTQFFIPAK